MRMRIGRSSRIVFGFICVLASGCGSSTDQLIAQLRNSDPATRRAAARALGTHQREAEKAVAALAASLEDTDVEVREIAADSLGQIGFEAKSVLPALEQAFRDSESSVRRTAALTIH